MKTYLTLLLSLFAVVALGGRPYLIKRLDVKQGLSNNYVLGITQDKRGFLWFATEEGLNKFDGTRFTTYYKNEPSSVQQGISGNELNQVYADPLRPVIWVATQRAGLNAYNYDTQTFTFYQHDPEDPQSLITNDVTNLAPSAKRGDGLWVCTYYRGVDYLNVHTGKFTHFNKKTVPQLPNEQTWTVIEDDNDQLYIGHVEAGMSILSLRDKSVKHFAYDPKNPSGLPGNDVRCLCKDSNGNVWVGTDRGLALFNPTTQTFIHFRNNTGNLREALSGYIFSIRQLKNNKLWIATEMNGIIVLDLQQNQFLLPEQIRFESIREGDNHYSLSSSSVRYLFQDSFDNVWIGTWGGGINFIGKEPPSFNLWSYSPIPVSTGSLTHKVVSSLCTDNRGQLWVGMDGGGLNVFEGSRRVAVYSKHTADLASNSVLSSLRDSEGNLWFGTFLGNVSRYDVRSQRFQTIELEKGSALDVRTLYEDRQKNIWIGTSRGVYVYSLIQKRVTQHYDSSNSGLRENLVRSIVQDGRGRFWIGTLGGGLGVYTANLQLIKKFDQYDGFCSNTINHLLYSQSGQMWVATGEGLVCFPSVTSFDYRLYQRKEGLGNTHIGALAQDENGNIWMSTNTGISCYLKLKKRFYNYDHFDNIPQGSFMSGCVTQDNDGIIYFGSINGVCSFNPLTTIHAPKVPPVVVTELKIPGRLINQQNDETIVPFVEGQKIELTHAQNSFSLTFNVQNYSLVNQVEYAYMLKGLEDSWYTVNEANSVTFRNIPPGTYEFLIKARLHNQDWPEEATSLTIRIHPPLWFTWWAKALYLLLLSGIGYLILYAYKRKLDIETLYTLEKKNREQEHELNQERLRFYTNITHELRTPLTLIIGPLEDLQKEASLPARQGQKLAVIHQSALRLLNLINQILEFRKTETQNKKLCVCKGNLAVLIREIGLKYKELNRKPDVNVKINIEEEEVTLFFDREIITIVLDNLISNAMKYTERGTVSLDLSHHLRNGVDYTEIQVHDTGYGISAEALPHIFDSYYQEHASHQASGTGIGLALVKKLVELHEGEIRVESVKDKGSTFYIDLLTDNIYPNALHTDDGKSEEVGESEKEVGDDSLEVATDSGKPILLIVEDNEDIRNYMVEAFDDTFEVRVAVDGKEGQQQALAMIPDIIVSDIMMPVMDGITLCRALKDDVRTSHIPIILLTAKDSLRDKEEGYEVGADSYLTKPFSASLLRSRIHNLLESRKKLVAQFRAQPEGGLHTGLAEKRAIIAQSISKLDKEFIEKITLLVEENLSSEKIDITYLSDKMCMSSSTLYRKMKALTGLSTNEYIRKVKMQNAERLLLEGRYHISEIVFKVGMNSVAYFRQCFKEEFGVLPSDYLKRVRPS